MEQYQGTCVFPGVVLARTMWIADSAKKSDPGFQGEAVELQNLEKSLRESLAQVRKIQAWTHEKLGAQEAEIFEAHIMMLEDPEYQDQIKSEIQNKKSAAQAIQEVTKVFMDQLSQASSEYLKERVNDLKDISQRLIRNLSAQESSMGEQGPCILVAEDLTPSDLMSFVATYPLRGVALHKGGLTSHTAILLRSMGIPALFGVENLPRANETTEAVLDSKNRSFILNPDSNTKYEYQKKIAAHEANQKELAQWRDRSTKLQDGTQVLMVANVGNQSAIDQANENGAEGVGLFRTEFLFMDKSRAPSEDEQFEIYKKALLSLKGKSLVIRTLDIGGDKEISYLKLPKEENPFLGVRGLRLCLKHPEIFLPQMKALIRAAEYGPLEVMFPMVTSPTELEEVFKLIPKSPKIKWGMMLEIPSNIFMIPEFAEHVSFFSVGSNDLSQYLTACDRMNSELQSLNDPYSPGILRALAYLAEQVKAHGKDLSVCGEIASDPLLIPFLIGIGVKKLSQNSLLIPQNRKLVSTLTQDQCRDLAKRVLTLSNRSEILKALSEPSL